MAWCADDLVKAQRHLARRDPVVGRVIKLVGPCTLRPNRDRFGALLRSIIAQQISTKAAASIHARLTVALGEGRATAAALLALTPEQLRAAGLSAGKARAVRDLAQKVQDGTVRLGGLHRLADEEVIAHLLPVYGIGRWTGEMFLIFSLGRLDVLPVHDLGLRAGIRRYYELAELPSPADLTRLAEPWRPYRSIATWYFWRSFGFVPQSGVS
jgi:DNA-3-methyladenine glycosylase II